MLIMPKANKEGYSGKVIVGAASSGYWGKIIVVHLLLFKSSFTCG
jgi:hypothetical protein